MIHFDFTVDDADAENILYLFQHRINTNNEMIIKEMCKKDECDDSYIIHLRNDIKYWEELKSKCSNIHR